jgi:hypothetical protein
MRRAGRRGAAASAAADRLDPAEPLFHELPLLLADRVAGMARRARIDHAAVAGRVLRDGRSDVRAAQTGDDVARVVALSAATMMLMLTPKQQVVLNLLDQLPFARNCVQRLQQ